MDERTGADQKLGARHVKFIAEATILAMCKFGIQASENPKVVVVTQGTPFCSLAEPGFEQDHLCLETIASFSGLKGYAGASKAYNTIVLSVPTEIGKKEDGS